MATAALYGASFLPLKMDSNALEPSKVVKMNDSDKVVQNDGNTIMIDGMELDKIELTEEELYIAKFIWAQIKDYEKSDSLDLDGEISLILRTLNTRLKMYKEADNVCGLIKKIVPFDFSKYEFEINSRLTYVVAKKVKRAVEVRARCWDNDSITYFAKKSWKPSEEQLKIADMKVIYHTDHFNYWSVTYKKAEKAFDPLKMSEQEEFLARVIYSETSTKCTPEEVKLVCKVIMNRINNIAFGNRETAYDVVNKKSEFNCINDKGNSNWKEFTPTLNKQTIRDSLYAHYMMLNDQDSIKLPKTTVDSNGKEVDLSGIVYYHDKSMKSADAIKKWTNIYWKPIFVIKTKNFTFYKIVENNNKAKRK